MKSLLNQSTWHGMRAWALESEYLRTVVVPDMGAKLVSLFNKRNQLVLKNYCKESKSN